MGVISSIKKNGFKYFTPSRIWMYIRSKWRAVFGINVKQKDIVAFSKMVTYRNLTCSECAEKGECVKCGCPVGPLTSSIKASCSDGKWPAHDPKNLTEDWAAHELKEGILWNILHSK